VGDRRIEVVRNVRRSDLVMEEVDDAPRVELVVRAVDGVEGALDEVVIAVSEMRNVDVGVLEPALLPTGKE
jgi:hypothetical protein